MHRTYSFMYDLPFRLSRLIPRRPSGTVRPREAGMGFTVLIPRDVAEEGKQFRR